MDRQIELFRIRQHQREKMQEAQKAFVRLLTLIDKQAQRNLPARRDINTVARELGLGNVYDAAELCGSCEAKSSV
jgi:hypothetical protein